ncbi:hypothetical protein C1T17_05085 [Sphingobium sp. SCG-1]|uniref:DUF2357 domain-containing protein n=1 Tax=Sphingobium sp. SCG-1 TaxID=2072936 RepID=UPI000CD6B2C3|nr:DUF2357 domain-containing protein [Sphingobium sp. SCG-1]AUW57566.1 hypothetical protein C1T17_05085 [Sphingobium sp. SCG-1]
MSELRVRNAASGSGWRIWPDPELIPSGSLVEASDCLFELVDTPGAGDADLFIDDVALEALRTRDASTARWRWSPGFHAGSVECQLRIGSRRATFDVLLDPAQHKLTRDAFDTMVREILEDSFALFSLSAFHKSVARGDGRRPPPIARLQFLRSRIAEIVRIVEAIDAAPRRELRAEERVVALHQAAGATGAEILKSFRSGRIVAVHPATPLHPGLAGRLPQRIVKRVRRSSLDRREHREMKACLRLWSGWLAAAATAVASAAASPDAVAHGWPRRLRRLAHRLDGLIALPLFESVGEAQPRVTASAVWQGDPKYRRFQRLYRDMSLGIASLFGDFLDMPLARTFDLYELWCFLRLLRAAAEREKIGAANMQTLFLADASGLTIAANAVSVPIDGTGLTLCFQRRYREYWREADGIGSFSRDMQPDIVIEQRPTAKNEGTLRLIVIDAKYRIGGGLNDALSSAHMYRDAIVRGHDAGIEGAVTAAYLLAPDAPFLSPEWRQTRLPGRLFHPDYRRRFRFGAVTLQPGMAMGEIQAALDAMIADATATEHAQ